MDSLYLHDGFRLQLLELPCENRMTLLGSVSVILCIFVNVSRSSSYEDLPGGETKWSSWDRLWAGRYGSSVPVWRFQVLAVIDLMEGTTRHCLSRKVWILCTCMKVSGSSCYRLNPFIAPGHHMTSLAKCFPSTYRMLCDFLIDYFFHVFSRHTKFPKQ